LKIKVKFFAIFRELFDSEAREVELEEGAEIGDLLALLCDSPQRRQAIFDHSGVLKPYIKILRDGRHLQFLDGMHTRLNEGSVVTIFPPVGGG